jgi:hypothetical protein
MTRKSHDHNFKNIFLDFPNQALEWIFPQAIKKWGSVKDIEFVRQEPKKDNLSDASLELDMPILFSFEEKQLLLWLVEFQEDKSKFSIYKLLRYTTDYMEAYPDAVVVPTVLFTDRKKWRKDVMRELETKVNDEVVLRFKYIFFKLFDFKARDYYNTNNPMVRILLPKMNYKPEEKSEVIKHAYIGLYQLSPMRFDKYIYFIDLYAEVSEAEREKIFKELEEQEEMESFSEYIKDKGRLEGVTQASIDNILAVLEARFGQAPESIKNKLWNINDPVLFKKLVKKAAITKSCEEFMREC